MIDRYALLQMLVEFAKPINELRALLRTFEWDFDGVPITMNRGHIRNILKQYIKGEISAQDVADWANLIEGREDITFEMNDADRLNEIIYELANTELTEKFSCQRANEIIGSLISDNTKIV